MAAILSTIQFLVCLELLEKFDRILYVNFSYHHCEAVEEAFYASSRIVTLSMHSDTMQTGQVSDNGQGTGKKYSLNIPFGRGVTDDLYFKSFESCMEEIRKNFEPQVVVCVVDPSVLGGDANGDFNLSSRCFVKCMKVFKDLVYNRNKVPCILLGGKSPVCLPTPSYFFLLLTFVFFALRIPWNFWNRNSKTLGLLHISVYGRRET